MLISCRSHSRLSSAWSWVVNCLSRGLTWVDEWGEWALLLWVGYIWVLYLHLLVSSLPWDQWCLDSTSFDFFFFLLLGWRRRHDLVSCFLGVLLLCIFESLFLFLNVLQSLIKQVRVVLKIGLDVLKWGLDTVSRAGRLLGANPWRERAFILAYWGGAWGVVIWVLGLLSPFVGDVGMVWVRVSKKLSYTTDGFENSACQIVNFFLLWCLACCDEL